MEVNKISFEPNDKNEFLYEVLINDIPKIEVWAKNFVEALEKARVLIPKHELEAIDEHPL